MCNVLNEEWANGGCAVDQEPAIVSTIDGGMKRA
jgi:hypothetical protein